MLLFQGQKEEISKKCLHFHTSILTVPPLYRPDASKKGLGAVLLQNSKPVMFVSRALTGSERNYQNLERECLATIWGMEKFHYFLYGKDFHIGNRSKTSDLDLQKAYGGNFPKDPKIDC